VDSKERERKQQYMIYCMNSDMRFIYRRSLALHSILEDTSRSLIAFSVAYTSIEHI